MLTVAFLCLLVVVCVVKVLLDRYYDAFEHILPPMYPGALPFIGHAHYLIADTKFIWTMLQRIGDTSRKLGGIMCSKLGSDIYYIITDPDDALTVANTCMQKHYFYSFLSVLAGQGLITGSGEVYKRHRKLLNSSYTASVTHGYLQLFNDQARKLVGAMDAHSGKGPFDPSPLMKHTSLETSCLTTFGLDVKNENFLKNYMTALDEVLHMITQRCLTFYLHTDFAYKLSGQQKKVDQLVKTIHKMSTEVIQQKKAVIKGERTNEDVNKKSDFETNEEIQFKPFLDRLIELSMDGLLTDDEVTEEANTNIAAAFETTAYTLVHAAVLLGSHPEVQQKMYNELVQVLGTDRDVCKDDLQKLVYIKAVIKESLRVIPTVPVVLRYIDKEVELKTYTLRANSQCAILPVGMHRSPVWGPDADKFKPERWLDPAKLPANANYFAGFSMGKRSCVGMTFSMTILTVILAHMVREFKWTGDVTKLELKLDITLRPVSGQEISIQRRRKNMLPG